jgi:hypothetical protein
MKVVKGVKEMKKSADLAAKDPDRLFFIFFTPFTSFMFHALDKQIPWGWIQNSINSPADGTRGIIV